MRAGILIFPGINRERDMALAVTQSFGATPRMVWHRETDLAGLDLVIIPSGFSFGDYLRAGALEDANPITKNMVSLALSRSYQTAFFGTLMGHLT